MFVYFACENSCIKLKIYIIWWFGNISDNFACELAIGADWLRLEDAAGGGDTPGNRDSSYCLK